jgi:hypothetical protein
MMMPEWGIDGPEQSNVGKLDRPISCQKIIIWNLVNAMSVMVDQKATADKTSTGENSRKDMKYLERFRPILRSNGV